MAKVILKGVGPSLDGEYDISATESFTGHQLHLIKQVAGLRVAEIEEAIEASDYDLFVCIAVIALWNAGKVTRKDARAAADVLLEADPSCIVFADDTAVEADAGPPEKTLTVPEPTSDSESFSESSSSTGGDRPEMSLVSTGSQR